MTRLICARCQYECQTELERIICPRCASIIDTPAEPPGATDLLGVAQNRKFAYVEEDVDLSSALGLATTGAVMQPDQAFGLSPDLSDEVLDLPESSQPIHSHNTAF